MRPGQPEPRVLIVRGRASSEPVDALDDHCRLLSETLTRLGARPGVVSLDATGPGVVGAARRVLAAARQADGVLIQHTHLMWSRRGFPGWFVPVVAAARASDRPVAVLFHDPNPFGGTRVIDRVRNRFQVLAGRSAAAFAHSTLVSVAPDRTPFASARLCVTPPNIPPVDGPARPGQGEPVRVVVFGLTGGAAGVAEARIVARVMAAIQCDVPAQLVAIGNGTAQHRGLLASATSQLECLGVLSPTDLSRIVASSHIGLFVRGPVSSRRSSAVCLIAHGLPVVAWEGHETAPPITEAGLLTAPLGDVDTLVEHAVTLARDPELRRRLGERSRLAYERWFTWERCAATVLDALGLGPCGS